MTSDKSGNTGTGPGALTPDGCAVEFYARLPPAGEPEIVHAAVPPGAGVLDLGCGTGRIAAPLLDLGHPVTAVDESPEMLARVDGRARTVRCAIGALRLDERFDAVLLASHLVNTPDSAARSALLRACRRHVAEPGGSVLIQRHAPEAFDRMTAGQESRSGGVRQRLARVERPEPGLLSATVEYRIGARCWTQTFRSRRLDDAGLAAELAAVGLRFAERLTPDGGWVRARPELDSR